MNWNFRDSGDHLPKPWPWPHATNEMGLEAVDNAKITIFSDGTIVIEQSHPENLSVVEATDDYHGIDDVNVDDGYVENVNVDDVDVDDVDVDDVNDFTA